MDRKRHYLWSLPLDILTLSETIEWVESAIRARKPMQHTVVNAAKIVHSRTDQFLKKSIVESDLVNIAGQAVVWAARLLGVDVPERVAGVDLMWELLRVAEKKGYRVYFLGATRLVVELMVQRLALELPKLQIAGFRDGYFSGDEGIEVATQIRESKADILYVGMPTPRKERFISDHLERMNVPFAMGVGGSFDVLSGRVKRAPVWVQRVGMEWAFRLSQEPRRLLKRYALTNFAFLSLVFKEILARAVCARPNR